MNRTKFSRLADGRYKINDIELPKSITTALLQDFIGNIVDHHPQEISESAENGIFVYMYGNDRRIELEISIIKEANLPIRGLFRFVYYDVDKFAEDLEDLLAKQSDNR